MILHDKGVNYLTFKIFDDLDFIRHCFSTKIGGVSKGYYSSLNLGFTRGDDYNSVMTNYKLLSKAVGFDYNNIVMSDQVHDTKIYSVSENDRGKGITKENDIKNIDGLITDEPNLVLTTFYADCVPLFFADKNKKVIAVSHSGWKGTVSRIGEKTVDKMISKYNCSVENIFVGIGPSICGDCFEVDEPVYLEFKKAFSYCDNFVKYNEEKNKYYIDMWGINEKMLKDLGIENIEVTEYCTKCRNDLFYSHRVMGNNRGTLAGFIELTK